MPQKTLDQFIQDGTKCNDQKNYLEAIAYFEKVIPTLTLSYESSHDKVVGEKLGMVYHQLGRSYFSLAKYETAIRYCQTGLDIRYQVYGRNTPHPDIANTLHNIGSNYARLEKYEEALHYYQAALDMMYQLYGQDKPHPDIANNLRNILLIQISNKNYSEAWKNLASLHQMSQQLFEAYASLGNEKDMRTIWEEYLGPVNDRVLTLLCVDSNQEHVSWAYPVALSNKIAVRRLLIAHREILCEINEPEVLNMYQQYQTCRQQEANLAFTWSNDPKKTEQIQKQQQELDQRCKELETTLNQRCLAFRRLQQYPKITLHEIQSQMDQNTVLLEFMIFYHTIEKKDWLCCFVVSGKSVFMREPPTIYSS